jgi:hypothetical protein
MGLVPKGAGKCVRLNVIDEIPAIINGLRRDKPGLQVGLSSC